MKKALLLIAVLGTALSLNAAEAKEVKLKGTGMCAKCELSAADKCTNVLQVKGKNGKTRTYTFTANMDHGKYFCQGTTEGLMVTGTVEKKDGKLMLTPKAISKKES